MLIDVSSILKESGGVIRLDVQLDMADMEFMGESYKFTAPTKIKGTVSNNGKALILRAKAEYEFTAHCYRCLDPVTVTEIYTLDETLIQNDGSNDADDDSDIIRFEGHAFEIDGIAESAFIMNTTGMYLCSEDCKGLCPKCGKNLNNGDCGCDNTEIDPRWAGLLDIMNNTGNDN